MRKMRSQLKRKHRTLKENADKKTYLKMHKLEEDKEALGKKYGEAFDLAEKLDLVPGSELKTKIMGMMEEQWNDIEDLIDVYVEKFSKGGDETVITESRKRKSATVTLAESVNMFLENDESQDLEVDEVLDWISGYYANMNKNSRNQLTKNLAKFGIDTSGNNEMSEISEDEIESALKNPAFIKFYNKNS